MSNFNLQSPIMNNMFGTVPNYGTVPQIGNIGGFGYNMGGYYNNMYNYYNPYEIRRQQELMEAQMKEQRRQYVDLQKMMIRCCNTYFGDKTDDQLIDLYFNQQVNPQKIRDVEEYNHLASIEANLGNNLYINYNNINYINKCAEISEKIQQRDPMDESLYDYLSKAGELYVKALENDNKQKTNDLTQLYHKGNVQRLLNMHNNSKFNAFNKDFNIDDMEVSLPEHLKGGSEYQRRKQQFLNAILNKQPGGGL